MFLVAGLGNPGEEYALTPHNLGFLTIDRLAERHGIRVTRKDSRALVGVGEIDGHPVMLAKPQTYMNLSGTSLAPLMEKHSDRAGPAGGGLRRAGSALAGAADQAERLGGRPQRHEVGDRAAWEPANLCGCGWGFTRAIRCRSGAEFVLAPFKRSQNEGIGRIHRLRGRCGSFHNRRGRRKGHDEIQSSRPRLKHRGSMRIYEELFIVKPDAPEEEVDQFVEQLRTQLTAAGRHGRQSRKMGQAPAGLQGG